MNSYKVYIAGPVQSVGPPTYNRPAFEEAANVLRDAGYLPVNPLALPGAETEDEMIARGAEWHEFMRRDIPFLVKCDGVALLPGWQRSRGAGLEVHVARALGMPIHNVRHWPLLGYRYVEEPSCSSR